MVPDEDLPTLARMLRALASGNAVIVALEHAPEDDDGELSEETVAALAHSRRAAAEGRVVSDVQMRRQLGLAEATGAVPEAGRWGQFPSGTKVDKGDPLFPKVELPE